MTSLSAQRSAIQQQMAARHFSAALEALDTILAEHEDTECLYMKAACQRYLGQYEPALSTLAKLKALAPDHSRAFQEEGHTRRLLGQREAALAAYATACHLNPALLAGWRRQLELLQQPGDAGRADAVQRELNWVEQLPKPLLAALDLLSQGQLLKAEDLCRRFLRQVPDHVEGMRILANIGMRMGVLDEAEFLLASALKFAPDHNRVRTDYIQALRKQQKFAQALDEAQKLLGSDRNNPRFISLCAVEYMQTGDYDQALELFDEVLEKLPGDPTTLTAIGHTHKTVGRYDEAVTSYRAALASHPAYGEARYSLANLKVYRFSDSEIAEMKQQEQAPGLSHGDRVFLCFALGKALEDRREYEQSFAYYQAGNALKKTQSLYRADRMSEDLDQQRKVCTAELFERRSGTGHAAPDPIFIVGLPRAGSTLLEQILSSHSQVEGTLELPNILALSQHLRRRQQRNEGLPYPEILAELGDEELAEFGRRFIEDTQIHRTGAPRFIDKMPNNFRHIGLIRLMLPNACVIDARRHPMACCFSGFKQLFAEGQEFTYGLEDLGQYYRDYVQLMDHWDNVLPGFVLRVRYEDVVADLEGQVRRILDFCDLPFEPSCLEFHRTERSVRTPSSEQVRQPIYNSGLEQWKHYESHLEPLRRALGDLAN